MVVPLMCVIQDCHSIYNELSSFWLLLVTFQSSLLASICRVV